jgi:hypothetical protein
MLSKKFTLLLLATALAMSYLPISHLKASVTEDLSCSIYDAAYKPHPSYFPQVPILEKPKSLDFVLTIRRPSEGERGGSHRSIFFYIDAFDRQTGAKISTLRLGDTCSNGIVRCDINTHEGQFRPNDSMKELESGIAFEPIALTKDLARVEYSSTEAPYIFIFPDTLQTIYNFVNKSSYEHTVDEFVRFYTDTKEFPDFSGYDVWILNSCATNNN